MSTLEIIGAPQSNFVASCRIAANEKGVAHVNTFARPHSPEIDAVHPAGLIPVMRHGDATLFESKAICAYIDRAFPGPALTPSDPLAAATMEQWCSYVCTSVQPTCMVDYVQSYFFNRLPDGSPNRPRIEAALPKMRKQLGVLDKAVGRTGHLVGGSHTIADMLLWPMIFYVNKLPEGGEMIAAAPALSAWFKTAGARKGFADAAPPPMPGR